MSEPDYINIFNVFTYCFSIRWWVLNLLMWCQYCVREFIETVSSALVNFFIMNDFVFQTLSLMSVIQWRSNICIIPWIYLTNISYDITTSQIKLRLWAVELPRPARSRSVKHSRDVASAWLFCMIFAPQRWKANLEHLRRSKLMRRWAVRPLKK